MKMSIFIDIYKFKGIDAFYSDMSGNFFNALDQPIKKEVHEGRLVIRIGNKRYGMKTLRALAYKSRKEMVPEDLPF